MSRLFQTKKKELVEIAETITIEVKKWRLQKWQSKKRRE